MNISTSKLFKISEIKEDKSLFMYSDICVGILALIARIENKPLLDILTYYNYSTNALHTNRLIDLENDTKYIILKDEMDIYKEYKLYKNEVDELEDDVVLKELRNYKNNKINTLKTLVLIDRVIRVNNVDNYLIDKLSMLYIFKNIYEINNTVDLNNIINNIHTSNYNLRIKYIFSKELVYYFNLLDINKVKDINIVNNEVLNILFIDYYDQVNDILLELSKPIQELYKNKIDEIELFINKKPLYFDVFTKRNGIYGECLTLDEIGTSNNLTRERVRQIESMLYKTIKSDYANISEYIKCYFSQSYLNQSIINKEDIINQFDKRIYNYTIVLLNIFDIDYKYSKDYDVIYIDGSLDIEIKNRLNLFSTAFGIEQYSSLNTFEKNIVDKHFSLRESKYYLKSGSITSDIYSYIVDTKFPEGIVLNDESMEIFNEVLVYQFGIPAISSHALQAVLARLDYINVDKGKYLNIKYTSSIDDILVNKVISFISTKDVVYYTTVYETFKEEFNSIGVYNRYYVKGLIDKKLPKNFIRKRDYISCGEDFKTSNEAIVHFMKNTTGVVTVDNLKKEFPGVEEYVFFNCMYQINDILHYNSGKSFILLDNLNIDNTLLDIIEEKINNLFKELNTKVITSYKLYDCLLEKHEDIMKRYPMINSQFIIFSLVASLFSDKYYFRRPYIYTEDADVSAEILIYNYINSLDSFNISILQSYTKHMRMRGIDNYLRTIIDNSEEFVQINIDTCVRKKLLNISEEDLILIEKILDETIVEYSAVETILYNNYESLPKLNYSWNKYLLVGIIRSYLSDKYSISYSTIHYITTDFGVKKRR